MDDDLDQLEPATPMPELEVLQGWIRHIDEAVGKGGRRRRGYEYGEAHLDALGRYVRTLLVLPEEQRDSEIAKLRQLPRQHLLLIILVMVGVNGPDREEGP